MTGNNADVFHSDFIVSSDESAHTFIRAIIKRGFADKYFQASFLPLFQRFFARIGPHFYTDQLCVGHIRCVCIARPTLSVQ